ncbi:MAG: ABC transporter substrate-binding protein [Gaiellaceae bacterium]
MAESLGEHTFARQLAPLRADPADDAEQVTQALAGEPLRVLEERNDWVLVETDYAYPGWVRRAHLGGERDPDWLRPVADDPVEHARTLLDARYEWGGMTCAGIDCSGLVHMAFRACGRLVPRDADQQEAAAERLSEADLRSGDLITYGPAAEADHIAFWVGGGRILHATGRDGVERVIEEKEPAELRWRRRALLRLGAVAVGLLSLLLAAGCGSSGHTTTSGEHRRTSATTTAAAPKAGAAPAHQFPDFRIAMDEATDYLDPGLSDTTEGWGVMWNVYLPLLGYRHANGRSGAKLVPYLATSLPQISRDERTYRLTLREGLRYSNGQPVKASDFKKTVERDFLLDSAGAGFFRNIVGAKVFAKRQKGRIRGIVVDDPTRTILIHLVAPQADFANVLASEFAAPVPASSPPADTSLHPLPSTGPYAITSYRPRERIVEERNRYFDAALFHGNVPAGNPDRITWDIVPTATVALRRVVQKKDDWMGYYQIPSKRLVQVAQKYGDRLRTFMPPNLMYFFMNTRVPPFSSVKVRRAVNYAISRRWLKHLAGGLAHTTENILPLPYASFRPHSLYRHNLRKAIRLVRESGYRGRRVFVWNHDVAADRPFTAYLVTVLNRLGFHATEKVVTAGSYWTTIGDEKTRAQIGFADFVQDYPHPLDWFGLLDGQRITPTHNSNYANFDVGWANREIEALTRRPELTPEVDSGWAALDRKVMRLAPWAPFLNQEETDFFSPRVELGCYVNSVLYEFDYASICVKK